MDKTNLTQERVVINMTVKDDTDFLSKFSTSSTPVISGEVAEFLENATNGLKANQPLSLKITSECIDQTEKGVYTKAIKQYYCQNLVKVKREIKTNNIISLCLALIGVIILTLAVFLEYKWDSVIWSEVVDIAAWVFLWEAVDTKFFKTKEAKTKQKRYLAFTQMTVDYN